MRRSAILLAIGYGLPAALAAAVVAGPRLVAWSSASGEPLSGCLAIDGDTLRCGAERIRLLGIDAPEMGGRCRPGRRCALGDSDASKAALADAASGPLTIQRVGTDRYGRTLALVSGPAGDLSCGQLKAGRAIYRRDWDDGGRVAAICPADVE
jgi:hypothetical protein